MRMGADSYFEQYDQGAGVMEEMNDEICEVERQLEILKTCSALEKTQILMQYVLSSYQEYGALENIFDDILYHRQVSPVMEQAINWFASRRH